MAGKASRDWIVGLEYSFWVFSTSRFAPDGDDKTLQTDRRTLSKNGGEDKT